MSKDVTDSELALYLDEALGAEAMASLERALRDDTALLSRLHEVHARREAGIHSLGEIWRRHRLSCPSRDQWGSYLLGALSPAEADYYTFHVSVAACRVCQANLDDLRERAAGQPAAGQSRQRKYFQSSAGRLPARAK